MATGLYNYSPAELSEVQKMMGMPPAQQQQAFYGAVMKGMPIHKLLYLKSEVERQEAARKVQEMAQMAAQSGGNPAPQTSVADDLMAKLQGNRGVAGLPVSDEMFTAAGGGIVAFNGEDNDQEVQEAPERLSRRMGFKRPIPSPEEKERMTGEFAKAMLVDAPLMASGAGVGRALFRAPTSATRVAGSIPITRAAWIPGRTAGPLYPYTAAAERAAMYSGIGGLGALGTSEMIGAGQRREQAQEQQKQLQDEYAKLTGAVYPGEATGVPAGIQTVLGGKATPGAGRAASVASTAASRARDTEMESIDERMKQLGVNAAQREQELKEAAGNRPKVLTPEEAQEQARKEREDALKKSGMKSYKERIDELAGEAKTLDRDRDTDRWLALAQGFFAMGAGKSRYALQNMSEGLGVTTTQLQSAEKEYRKGMQAQKDRAALLQEAERKEVLGDVAAGRELRKDALRAQERFDETQLRIRSTLLQKTEAERTSLAREKESLLTRRQIAEEGRLGREAQAAQVRNMRMMDPKYQFTYEFTNAKTDAERDAVTRKWKPYFEATRAKEDDLQKLLAAAGGAGGTDAFAKALAAELAKRQK